MSRFIQLCLTVAILTALAAAQDPLSTADADKVNHRLGSLHRHDTLKCSIMPWHPLLDFSFRFEAGYIVECPFSDFAGKETDLAIYARVTPNGGLPVLLGDVYRVPAAPPETLAKIDPRHVHTLVNTSGSFALGEGGYTVEVLVVDNRSRSCHKRWTIKAKRSRSQRSLPVAIEAGTVTHVWPDPWPGPVRGKGTGLQVTVLLHAAPMNPRAAKLRAWDRAFLLQSLSTLLQKMPCESVRLIAFNLDQEREVYRQERFDGHGFDELSHTLRAMELGTVSYRALQRAPAANSLLASLANEQLAGTDRSDAVIFLGPTMRVDRKTPSQLLHPNKAGHPRFFYFEYYPWQGADFADSIEYLTETLHGSTFHIHSPAEFGKGMQKLLRQFTSVGNVQAIGHWGSASCRRGAAALGDATITRTNRAKRPD